MGLWKSKRVVVGAMLCLAAAVLVAIWTGGPARAATPTTRANRPIPASFKTLSISITGTSGTIVPADSGGNPIQIWAIEWNTSSATTVEFLSGTNSFTNAQSLLCDRIDAPRGEPRVDCAPPWKETNPAEAFKVNFGASTTMTGEVLYTAMP